MLEALDTLQTVPTEYVDTLFEGVMEVFGADDDKTCFNPARYIDAVE